MLKTVAIGKQDFGDIIRNHCFYVDKTFFIKEWWENQDNVTLITRPRRFGKTLTLSMAEYFFSVKYAGRGDLFEGFAIWKDPIYRKLQGTYPVLSLSFANIKETNFKSAKMKLHEMLIDLYEDHSFLYTENFLSKKEMDYFDRIAPGMDDSIASLAIQRLAKYLSRYYNKKVIIFLDEYDTPMQEAYVNGYWDQLAGFIRNLLQTTFKTNPYLERGLMTGITRVSKESIFSDLNNLEVVTTTSQKYAYVFGFTEQEVFAAMDEFGYTHWEEIKAWYDGFAFGNVKDIYNPWSILKYLRTGECKAYWANISSNRLIGELLKRGDEGVKKDFETLMLGGTIRVAVDEEITFRQLDGDQEAIWSFLLASGYLKIVSVDDSALKKSFFGKVEYELSLTNGEVRAMCSGMVREWFSVVRTSYNSFVDALLKNDVVKMNTCMNQISNKTFSFFDSGRDENPECFYHGFVLGLIAELADRYRITSNRESGDGRYDVMLEPFSAQNPAMILEFKALRRRDKNITLQDAVKKALAQIQEKKYDTELIARGVSVERIRHYGIAFRGKDVWIGAS